MYMCICKKIQKTRENIILNFKYENMKIKHIQHEITQYEN